MKLIELRHRHGTVRTDLIRLIGAYSPNTPISHSDKMAPAVSLALPQTAASSTPRKTIPNLLSSSTPIAAGDTARLVRLAVNKCLS
jgi:hypothetical protein